MDNVNPERNESGIQEPSKTAAIKQKWIKYVESAILHGMQQVFFKSNDLAKNRLGFVSFGQNWVFFV